MYPIFSGDGEIYIFFDTNAHKMSLITDSKRRWIFDLYFQTWRLSQKNIMMEGLQTENHHCWMLHIFSTAL